MEEREYRVTLAECRCAGAPHPADWVEVVDRATPELGAAVIRALRSADGDEIAADGLLVRACLRFGIARWSFVDENGDPEPIRPEATARLLPFADAYRVADLVADLHTAEIVRPLLPRSSTPSPGGQTAGSTSPTPATGKRRRTPSSPSSPTGTDGSPSVVPDR